LVTSTPVRQSYQSNRTEKLRNLEERYSFRKCVEVVKAAVPAIDVADYHAAGQGDSWRRLGADKWSRRCILPDHEDRTPSFVVYEATNSFYCFGCSRGGDVIDLEQLCGSHTVPWTAVIALSQRHDIDLPRRPKRWHEWQSEKVRRWNALRDVLAESYRRRLFRMYRPILECIGDPEEREKEARSIWEALWPIARDCAEQRLFEREAA
jgi:hypothetical protein